MAPSATGGDGEALSCPQAVMEKLPESLEGIFPAPQGGRSGDWRTVTFLCFFLVVVEKERRAGKEIGAGGSRKENGRERKNKKNPRTLSSAGMRSLRHACA